MDKINKKSLINWHNLETEYLVYDLEQKVLYRIRKHVDKGNVFLITYGVCNNETVFELNGTYISNGAGKVTKRLKKMDKEFQHLVYDHLNNMFEKMRYEEFLRRYEKNILEICQKLSGVKNPSSSTCLKLLSELKKIEAAEIYYREQLINVIKNIRDFVRTYGEIR